MGGCSMLTSMATEEAYVVKLQIKNSQIYNRNFLDLGYIELKSLTFVEMLNFSIKFLSLQLFSKLISWKMLNTRSKSSN